jgi:hypothetical protein
MSLRRVPALLPIALAADAAMAVVHHGAALEPTAWANGAGLASLATRIVALCALATAADGLAAALVGRAARAARTARTLIGVAAAIEITYALFALWLAPRGMIDLGGPVWRTLLLGREIGLPLGLAVLATTGVLRRPMIGGAAFALLGFLIALAAVPRAIGPMMPALPLHQGLLFLAVVQAIASALVVAAVAAAPHTEAAPQRHDVHAGLERAGAALFARVLIAAAALPSAALAIAAGAARPVFLVVALPAASAVATAVLAIGVARASVWAEAGAPRLRFAIAAMVLGAAAVLELIMLVLLYNRLAEGSDTAAVLVAFEDLAWAVPVLEVGGLLVLASSLAATARVAGAEAIARQVPALALVLVACLGTSAWLAQALPGTARDTWVLLSIGAAVTTAIATFGLARLIDAVVGALHGRDDRDAEVPSAVVRSARP